MVRTRFCLAVIAALFAQLLTATMAEAKWLRAETPNFVIYSEGSDKETRRFAINLERFHATTQWAFGVKPEPNPNKLTVYFLANQAAVSKLQGNRAKIIAGFYSPREEGSFAVANRSKSDSQFDMDGMTVLFHEYVHHFMFRNFSYAYPSWYVEGFAEYLSTATFDDKGAWTIGKPALHRARSLLTMPKVPIDALLFGRVPMDKPEEVGPYYGRSWLLVHMLNMRPEHKGKLKTYFDLISAGKSHRDAAVGAFGDLAALDKSLDDYLAQKMRYIGADKPIAPDPAVTLTALDDLSGQLVGYRLDRLSGGLDTAGLNALASLAAANPAAADAWYELAMAQAYSATRAADDDARRTAEKMAEASVDRALAADPNHVRANVLKAQLSFARLRAAGEDKPATWSAARQYLITANKGAADDPLVLVRWYDSFGMQGRAPSQTARDGLARAFALAPEVTDIRVKLALDLASQGQFDQALGLVEYLAQHPHHAARGQALVNHIKRMRDRAAPKKAA